MHDFIEYTSMLTSVSVFRWSRPVAVVATMWLLVQLAIAMLPSGFPVTPEVKFHTRCQASFAGAVRCQCDKLCLVQNMNWTGPCLGFLLLGITILWVVKLRHHFSGLETVFTNSDLLKTW